VNVFLLIILGGCNLGVEPPTIELSASESGKSYYGFFTVHNRGNEGYYVSVQYFDFGIDSLDGSPFPLPQKSTPYSISGWLTFEPTSFYLPPRKSVKINYTLTPPSGTEGSYYGMILISTITPGTRQFRTGLDIGVNFLVTIGNRDFIKKTKLDTLIVQKLDGNVQFFYRIKNIGETHCRVKTLLEIKNKQGKVIQRYEPSSHTFLPPQGKRIYKFLWEKPLKGDYVAFAFITYENGYDLKEMKFTVK